MDKHARRDGMMMSVSCQNAGSMTTLSFSLSLRFPRTHPRSPRTPERKLILPPLGIDDLSGYGRSHDDHLLYDSNGFRG
jgi:hypothetical protein